MSAEQERPAPHPEFNTVLRLLAVAAEVDKDIEGGQPNGTGTIEPSDYREWYTKERESHHRVRITIYGPWMEGPA